MGNDSNDLTKDLEGTLSWYALKIRVVDSLINSVQNTRVIALRQFMLEHWPDQVPRQAEIVALQNEIALLRKKEWEKVECWDCGGQPSAPGAKYCQTCNGRAWIYE